MITRVKNSPGILSWNSHLLPGPLTSASLMSLVIVSLTRPDGSPPTFTMKGLPTFTNILTVEQILIFYLIDLFYWINY